MRITCGRCGYVADGLLDYENHRRAEGRPLPEIDWNVIAPERPTVSPYVRNAQAGTLPASDRTAGR